jgi:hypothetical protein
MRYKCEEFIWISIGTSGRSKLGNEPSASMKIKEFLDYPSDYQLLKKGSIPYS